MILKKQKYLLQLIFAGSQALLVAIPSVESILLMLSLMIGLTFLSFDKGQVPLPCKVYGFVAVIQVSCCINYYWNWCVSSKVRLIAEVLNIPSATLVVVTAILLALLGYLFQINLIKNFFSKENFNTDFNKYSLNVNDFRSWKHRLLFCVVCAFVSITICSENSFLYPVNTWTDPHCFMTVGKAMMNGMVPYRDLLEQKGPVHYFVYGLAWLFSKNTYSGIYILEIVAASFFLYYTSVAVTLYKKGTEKPAILLTAVLIYSSLSFRTGGTAEELCIPLLAYALYLALSFLQEHRELTGKDYIVIGLSA
ncbi:MAG: hypothetical protein J6F33_04930, partial [Acidaminococcaceae bacterium]|nr:hypothetical protein [Acidaminococcaceae bacterium]